MKQFILSWTMFFGCVGGMALLNLMSLLPKDQKYRICENPDELGYWLEPVDEEDI